MQSARPDTAPAHRASVRRPSHAAGEAVLMALATERPPLIALEPQRRHARPALVLGGYLRLDSRPEGSIAVWRRDAVGIWRQTDTCDDALLLTPAALIARALAAAVDACIAEVEAATPLSAADRAYVARRLSADLYPGATGAHGIRALRTALCRDVLDRELLRAACLVFGRDLRVADVNDMARAGAAVLVRVCRETPQLAPLLAQPVRAAARKGVPALHDGIIGALRRAFAAAPVPARLARRDWKWLAHQSNAVVRALNRPPQAEPGAPSAALAVRLFAATGVPRPRAEIVALAAPGMALERALGLIAGDADAVRLEDLARLLRLALGEADRRAATGASLRFLRDDTAYLVDWWIDQSAPGQPLVPGNATWPSLIRRQQRWHQWLILKHPEFMQLWESALPAHAHGDLRVVPLTDSLMLAREGMEMRHCVASYARDCAAGNTRIFALELCSSGERGTLELRRRASTWFAGQLKGPCNAEVPGLMRAAAERLAERYTSADRAR
jgi:hypothetical protein